GPRGGEDVALEADVIGLGRGEGSEVMGSSEGAGAGVEGLAVDAVGPPERPAELEWARCRAGEEAVAVAAGLGVVAGVEALGGDPGAGDGDVVGREAVEAPHQVGRRL